MKRGAALLALSAVLAGACSMQAGRPPPLSTSGSSTADCTRAALIPPSGTVLHSIAMIEPAPAWRSPASTTSPLGEQVRAAFCRLAGSIDGDIGFEIWLPREWNGRLLASGVGGEAGYFNYVDMARGVEQGFVAASTDTGHKPGERWIDDPRKAENYAHIAYHRLTEVAKAVIRGFYGEPASYSYFIGCSGGGRQGLRELQLYPGDYDGALIGAPGLDVPLLAARLLHVHLQQARTPAGELTAADWDLISRKAVEQCDSQDGLTDGVVADPRSCGFRVRHLLCASSEAGPCLSREKVATAEAIVAPLTDKAGGTYDFGLLPGITARPGGLPPLPVQMFGDVVHRDPQWDHRNFDLAADLAAARAAFPTMDASGSDLTRFAARGGKLILYHGWKDASVQPQSTIDLFDRLRPASRGSASDVARLYLVPGMQHCRGGEGTDRFGASEDRAPTGDPRSDMLAALVAWVERKSVPGTIVARRTDDRGAIDRTRPLCPYPARAGYRGSGDIDKADSFTCVQAASLPARL